MFSNPNYEIDNLACWPITLLIPKSGGAYGTRIRKSLPWQGSVLADYTNAPLILRRKRATINTNQFPLVGFEPYFFLFTNAESVLAITLIYNGILPFSFPNLNLAGLGGFEPPQI